MPWETTNLYIRSGHRSPDEFQPDSLRTIVLNEKEGIKAIVGKPEDKGTMEVQSYLFERGKGWTLDKAKTWFEKHARSQVNREHIFAILPFRVLEKLAEKPLRIRGVAMTAGMSRNFNIYTSEELQSFASKLVSAPVYVEHIAVPNAVGKIVKTEWDDQNLWYEAEIHDDEIAEKIRKGLIRHVSVGADYETLDVVDGKVPHGLHNAELSLVAVPGIPEANIQILEKLRACEQQPLEPIIAGEYVLGFYQDVAAFLPEHFRTIWIDKQNGVLAVAGKLREQPETERVHAIFFAKEKMWDQAKIRDWLSLHPDYMAPAGGSVTQTPLKEREKMSKKNQVGKEEGEPRNEGERQQLTERVWTRKYIDDLQDTAFAVILPNGKKEEGRTAPRTLRKFPHHDAQGRLDPAHLRNANARLSQSDISAEYKQRAMRHLATHKKRLEIGVSAEEEKLLEQEGANDAAAIDLEVSPEPVMDELIASVEIVVEEISDEIAALTARVERLEKAFTKESEFKGDVTESFLKNPKTMIAIEEAVTMIQNVLPSSMVERSWGFGAQRLCQELRGIILKLREGLKQNGEQR